MEPSIIDKMVRVVKVHYMNHSVLSSVNFCIRVEVDFLHPILYINGWDNKHIAIYDNLGVLTEEVYNSLYALYRYCGVSREELLLWVLSKIDFEKAHDKEMYQRLLQNFVF